MEKKLKYFNPNNDTKPDYLNSCSMTNVINTNLIKLKYSNYYSVAGLGKNRVLVQMIPSSKQILVEYDNKGNKPTLFIP